MESISWFFVKLTPGWKSTPSAKAIDCNLSWELESSRDLNLNFEHLEAKGSMILKEKRFRNRKISFDFLISTTQDSSS